MACDFPDPDRPVSTTKRPPPRPVRRGLCREATGAVDRPLTPPITRLQGPLRDPAGPRLVRPHAGAAPRGGGPAYAPHDGRASAATEYAQQPPRVSLHRGPARRAS